LKKTKHLKTVNRFS